MPKGEQSAKPNEKTKKDKKGKGLFHGGGVKYAQGGFFFRKKTQTRYEKRSLKEISPCERKGKTVRYTL